MTARRMEGPLRDRWELNRRGVTRVTAYLTYRRSPEMVSTTQSRPVPVSLRSRSLNWIFWVYKPGLLAADTPSPPFQTLNCVGSAFRLRFQFPRFQGSLGSICITRISRIARISHVCKSLRWVSFVVQCLIHAEPPARVRCQRTSNGVIRG